MKQSTQNQSLSGRKSAALKPTNEKRNRVYGRWYIEGATTPLERANNDWIRVSIDGISDFYAKLNAYNDMKAIADAAGCRVDPFPFTREGLAADRARLVALKAELASRRQAVR